MFLLPIAGPVLTFFILRDVPLRGRSRPSRYMYIRIYVYIIEVAIDDSRKGSMYRRNRMCVLRCMCVYARGRAYASACIYMIGFMCTQSASSIQERTHACMHAPSRHPHRWWWCMNQAVEWRQRWQRDVVIDLVGYRRHGHNELDDPTITQPGMYASISSHPPVLDIYTEQLLQQRGCLDQAMAKETEVCGCVVVVYCSTVASLVRLCGLCVIRAFCFESAGGFAAMGLSPSSPAEVRSTDMNAT